MSWVISFLNPCTTWSISQLGVLRGNPECTRHKLLACLSGSKCWFLVADACHNGWSSTLIHHLLASFPRQVRWIGGERSPSVWNFLQLAQKVMEQSLQYSVAWFSSQPSHITLFGSARLLLKDEEEGEAAASTVDAKWLMGREEAAVVGCPFCFSSSTPKTARHIGHLNGALPI